MIKENNIYSNIFKAGLVGMLAVLIKLIPFDEVFRINSTLGETGNIPKFYFIPMIVIYGLIAIVFVSIKNNLNLSKKGAFAVVFSFFVVVDTLMSRIEGNFFIEGYHLFENIAVGLVEPLMITIAIFCLWRHEGEGMGSSEKIEKYFKSRSIISWIWRSVVILLVSFLVYMVLGAIAYPITGPHMEKLIKIPSMFENFMIQILRGSAYLVVTVPLIIFWNNSKRKLFFNLAAINILLYPVLGYAFAYFFPLAFRLADGTVLTLHVIVMSFLQVKFLGKEK